MKKLFAVLAAILLLAVVISCSSKSDSSLPAIQDTGAALNTQNQASDYYNKLISQSDPSPIQKTVTYLNAQDTVQAAGIGDDGTTICIKYKNGLEAMILTKAFGNNIYASEISDLKGLAYRITNTLTGLVRYAVNYVSPSSVFADSNKKALILLPLESRTNYNLTSLDNIINALTSSGYSVPDIVTVKNENVTIDEMRKLGNYQFVYILTHGEVGCKSIPFLGKYYTYGSGAGLMTGVKVTDSNSDKWQEKGVFIVTAPNLGNYFALNQDFFSKYTYSGTFIYADACKSNHNDSLRSAFVNNGAAIYVGWDNDSFAGLSNQIINPALFPELAKQGMTFDQAYKNTVNKYFPITVYKTNDESKTRRIRAADGEEITTNTQDTEIDYTLSLTYKESGPLFVLNPASTNSYTITGLITYNGVGLAGVTVTLTGASSVSTTTDPSGNYSFSNIANGSYTLSFSDSGYTFSPSSASIDVNGGNFTVATDIATAQPTGSWTGIKQLDSSDHDDGTSVAVDTSGNVYVTGYTTGELDGNTNAGGYDIFLVKYNVAGIKQWTRQFGSSGNDFSTSVAVDASGNVYVGGYTFGSLDGYTNAGDYDIFLVKYNAAGTKQWTRQFGTATGDEGGHVAVDTSGNVYVTGWTLGGLDGNTNKGGSDIFLVKYNSAGTKQWTKQFGGMYSEDGDGIAVDTSGNIYISGSSASDLSGFGYWHLFLMKVGADGTEQWTRQGEASCIMHSSTVALDTSGNVYVTGSATGNLAGYTNAGWEDIVLVKYNSAGTQQWARQLGSAGHDFSTSVALDTSGNVFVTGCTSGNLAGYTNNGSTDMFLIKFNSAGTQQWTRQYGTSLSEEGDGVAVDASGNAFVIGTTASSGGSEYVFLVKYDSTGVIQ